MLHNRVQIRSRAEVHGEAVGRAHAGDHLESGEHLKRSSSGQSGPSRAAERVVMPVQHQPIHDSRRQRARMTSRALTIGVATAVVFAAGATAAAQTVVTLPDTSQTTTVAAN